MSGFFGMVRLGGRPVEKGLLEKILGELDFRGVDGRGIWVKGNLGGCFTLMRTGPTKQASQQPVIWRDRYYLWGDVRLDAREELQKELAEVCGAVNPDITSEELLLQAWAKWGEDALQLVLGDFSFALWDATEQSLLCARDFVGARPMYYAHVRGAFCFSNTLDVLRSVPEVSGELDKVFIGDYLVHGWNTELGRTVFKDIRRVGPGRVLKFSNSGVEERRFRKLPVEELRQLKRPEDYLEAYREVLVPAVRDRLPENGASLYLSGGLDSSTVCAVAAKLADKNGQKANLKAFTMSWEAFFADPEPSIARITAEYIGIAQEILKEDTLTPFEAVGTSELRAPEPGREVFLARERRQALRIAAHRNVVLSGDGGDDVLTGQGWPYLVQLWRNGDWKEIVREYGGYFWTHKRVPPLRGGFRTRARRLLGLDNPFADYPEWLNPAFAEKQSLRKRWLDSKNQKPSKEHPYHPEAYEALHDGYWGEILETEDAGWTGVRLETRAPLLDLRVLRFLLSVPPVPWCLDKELARTAMKNALPDAVRERPKSPLLQDPMEVCSARQDWAKSLPQEPPEALKEFVNWHEWCETFNSSKGSLTWRVLRPVSLLHWLKAVENT